MATLEIKVTGLSELNQRLGVLSNRMSSFIGAALLAEAEIEMTEAKRRTPVDTAALKGSGHVTGPFLSGRKSSVKMNFGGPAASYAIFVHEDLEAFHKVGQAKFLESVLNESTKYFANRIGSRLWDMMRSGR